MEFIWYHGNLKKKSNTRILKRKKAHLCASISLFKMPTGCLYKVLSICTAARCRIYYLIGNVFLGMNQCWPDIRIFHIFTSNIIPDIKNDIQWMSLGCDIRSDIQSAQHESLWYQTFWYPKIVISNGCPWEWYSV
jgi:hypothetical protein